MAIFHDGPPADVAPTPQTVRRHRMLRSISALFGGTQTRPAVTARQLLAYVCVEGVGRRASDLARALGQTRRNLSTAPAAAPLRRPGGRPRSSGGAAEEIRQIMLPHY